MERVFILSLIALGQPLPVVLFFVRDGYRGEEGVEVPPIAAMRSEIQ